MILALLGKFAFHVVGGHLFKSLITKIPFSPLIAAGEALGWRFLAGVLFSFYIGHDGFRHAINDAFKLLF